MLQLLYLFKVQKFTVKWSTTTQNMLCEMPYLKLQMLRLFKFIMLGKIKGNKRHVLGVMHLKELPKANHFQLQLPFLRLWFTQTTTLILSCVDVATLNNRNATSFSASGHQRHNDVDS